MDSRWFIMLPDIFHFFTIFGFGVLTGIFIGILFVLMYCWGGGEIMIKMVNAKDAQQYLRGEVSNLEKESDCKSEVA